MKTFLGKTIYKLVFLCYNGYAKQNLIIKYWKKTRYFYVGGSIPFSCFHHY